MSSVFDLVGIPLVHGWLLVNVAAVAQIPDNNDLRAPSGDPLARTFLSLLVFSVLRTLPHKSTRYSASTRIIRWLKRSAFDAARVAASVVAKRAGILYFLAGDSLERAFPDPRGVVVVTVASTKNSHILLITSTLNTEQHAP